MSESLTIIFAVVLLLLTVVASAVGIYLVIVLIEVRGTLRRINNLVDDASETVAKITAKSGNLGGLMGGLTLGMQLFKAFTGRLNAPVNSGGVKSTKAKKSSRHQPKVSSTRSQTTN